MKIGALILARANFGRWPDKVLFQLKGKSILEHVITKSQQLDVEHVIVSTTVNPEDKPIREIIVKTNCDSSLGNPDDRTSRICQAIKEYKLDYFIPISPATPFFDLDSLKKVVTKVKDNPGYDAYTLTNITFNCVPYIFNSKVPFKNISSDQEIFVLGIKRWYRLHEWHEPEVKNKYLFNANIAYKIQADNHRRICEHLGHFPKNYEEIVKALLTIQ